jgi:hypothetical protein
MTWTIEANQVKAANGRVVNFDFDIREASEVDGVLVVILEVPPGGVMTENVFGISPEGKVTWQIERTAANSTDPINCYIGITSHDQHIARIYNWNGINSALDVHTGALFDFQFAK